MHRCFWLLLFTSAIQCIFLVWRFMTVCRKQQKKCSTLCPDAFVEWVRSNNVHKAITLTTFLAFFEGLAGNGGDIDALFAIEDEVNQCAVDDSSQISEYYSHAHGKTIPARGRTNSRRQPSTSAQPIHPLKNTPSETSMISGPSKVRRGSGRGSDGDFPYPANTPAIGPSPLAQIYQPIVLEDEVEEEMLPSTSLGSHLQVKRLPSLSRQRRSSTEHHVTRPTLGGPPADHMAMPVPPFTVPERAEEEILPSGPPAIEWTEWTKRLSQMEERQQRIENLLVSLANELRPVGKRSADH